MAEIARQTLPDWQNARQRRSPGFPSPPRGSLFRLERAFASAMPQSQRIGAIIVRQIDQPALKI
jgi:hypothetical protein